ncbi:hypothetical protein [Terribacillus aidingensis]|uniref:hypothetical protein n=1 Tax=Terribacillus aidingensis TaxID=586416 RepID=UPI00344E0B67
MKDLELGGKQIKKGDLLLPLMKSANQDEQHFTNAQELDITRQIKRMSPLETVLYVFRCTSSQYGRRYSVYNPAKAHATSLGRASNGNLSLQLKPCLHFRFLFKERLCLQSECNLILNHQVDLIKRGEACFYKTACFFCL